MIKKSPPKIEALVFDLDGTAIPSDPDGMPSQAVIESVKKVQQKIGKVSIATGRQLDVTKHLLDYLGIAQPCILAGGTQIYDPVSKKNVWEKDISIEAGRKIVEIFEPYPYGVFMGDDLKLKKPVEIKIRRPERIFYMMYVPQESASQIVKKLGAIDEVLAHSMNSWQKGLVDIHVTHKHATKEHAMMELLRIFGVNVENVMVVGDNTNDLSLFKQAGWRVAMGNATDELKARADFVTDTVENDGLVRAIEKFIL